MMLMIIEYDSMYDEDIKDLLVELQKHISDIDKDGYNILTDDYRDLYFKKTLEEIEAWKGKIFLYKEDERIVGLIAGVINNYAIDNYDFKAPMRGRVTELVVSSSVRSKGIGKKLLLKMEEYLKSIGCHDVLLGVFCYNTRAISFYEANGYHSRTTDMIKSLGE